jgi:hypothetical protein
MSSLPALRIPRFHTIGAVLVSDFDFDLPPELIAQEPPPERGGSRMLILNRESGAWEDSQFDQLPEQLRAGDLLVLNDSRVIPARLFGTRVGNHIGKVEVLLTEQVGDWEWRALTRPARRMTVGQQLSFAGSGGDELLAATITTTSSPGWSFWGMSRCRHTFAVTTRQWIVSVTRLSMRSNAALSPHPPRGCTSPRKFLNEFVPEG